MLSHASKCKMDQRVFIGGGHAFTPDCSSDSTILEQSRSIAESLGQASLRRLDPLSQYALHAVHLARQAAGLAEHNHGERDVRSGVCVGTGLGAQSTRIRYARRLATHGLSATNPIDFPDSIDGAPAAHIAIRWGLQGPSLTFADGRASSVNALVAACRLVASGSIERMYLVVGDAFDPLVRDAMAESLLALDSGISSMNSDDSNSHASSSDLVLALILQRLDETSVDEPLVEVVGFHGSNCRKLELGPKDLFRDVPTQNKEKSPLDLSGAASIAGAWHGVRAPTCKNEGPCQDSVMKVRRYRCGLDDARFPDLAFERLA